MKHVLAAALSASLLAACTSGPSLVAKPSRKPNIVAGQANGKAQDVVLYALGLLDVDYRFGGSNPENGLDCSGMVSFIYRQAAGLVLPHNAARLAELGEEIDAPQLQAGDLVFFNTLGRSFSHVGIYLGDGRFIHAPSSNGKIRIDSLKKGYYAQRYESARRLLA